jgi:hypothetical protein
MSLRLWEPSPIQYVLRRMRAVRHAHRRDLNSVLFSPPPLCCCAVVLLPPISDAKLPVNPDPPVVVAPRKLDPEFFDVLPMAMWSGAQVAEWAKWVGSDFHALHQKHLSAVNGSVLADLVRT